MEVPARFRGRRQHGEGLLGGAQETRRLASHWRAGVVMTIGGS